MITDFEEYIRQSEPHKREKGYAWQTAIGLQAVDGLKTSDYLRETARQHIEGDITIEEVKQLVNSYYESKTARKEVGDRTEEADKVSARITELLSEQSFTFSPLEYISIHRRLFEGIYEHAGKIRDYNITKKEWVLNGETVLYAGADSIRETLDYDFAREKEYDYKHHDIAESVSHISQFVSDLWQIHPFGEGNTRQRQFLPLSICVHLVSTSATKPLLTIRGIFVTHWFEPTITICLKASLLQRNTLKHSFAI